MFLCYRAEDGVSVEADMFGTGWGLEMGGGWAGMLGGEQKKGRGGNVKSLIHVLVNVD